MNPNKENLNFGKTGEIENGITVWPRADRTVNGVTYSCKAVQTHFVERGEDYVGLVRQYILPVWQPGDLLFSSEKVAAMYLELNIAIVINIGYIALIIHKLLEFFHSHVLFSQC